MKRFLSFALCFSLLFALVPFSAIAAESEVVIDGVKYKLSDDNTYYIVSSCDTSVTEVTIISEISGIPVTTIGDSAFAWCSSLESIIMGNGTKYIGDRAFYFCENLKNIEIPDSIISIGYSIFESCNSLENIAIPENAVLGGYIFSGCEKITFTEYKGIMYYGTESNPYQVLYSSDNNSTEFIIHPDTKQIAGGAFPYSYYMTSIEIPNSVKTIGGCAFQACPLKSIEIPESVIGIGDEAFRQCYLTDIVIPESVIYLGKNIFYLCSSLENIYCEAETKPDGWDDEWNYDWNNDIFEDAPHAATIHWGYVDPNKQPEITTGDVNGNNKIDMSDYVMLKRAYFGTFNFSDNQKTAGDINKNGKIDMSDYVLLKRAYFGTYVIK